MTFASSDPTLSGNPAKSITTLANGRRAFKIGTVRQKETVQLHEQAAYAAARAPALVGALASISQHVQAHVATDDVSVRLELGHHSHVRG